MNRVLFLCAILLGSMTVMAEDSQSVSVKKETSILQKEGWMPEPGMPSIAQQLANTKTFMWENTSTYFFQEKKAVAPTFTEAYMKAYFRCLSDLIDNTSQYRRVIGLGPNPAQDHVMCMETVFSSTRWNLLLHCDVVDSVQYNKYMDPSPKHIGHKEDIIFVLQYKHDYAVENWEGRPEATYGIRASEEFENEIDAIKLQSFYRVLKDGNVEVMLLLAREIRESVLDRLIYGY